jgi:hypothetical protein
MLNEGGIPYQCTSYIKRISVIKYKPEYNDKSKILEMICDVLRVDEDLFSVCR